MKSATVVINKQLRRAITSDMNTCLALLHSSDNLEDDYCLKNAILNIEWYLERHRDDNNLL